MATAWFSKSLPRGTLYSTRAEPQFLKCPNEQPKGCAQVASMVDTCFIKRRCIKGFSMACQWFVISING